MLTDLASIGKKFLSTSDVDREIWIIKQENPAERRDFLGVAFLGANSNKQRGRSSRTYTSFS